jgi:hypothetical protein
MREFIAGYVQASIVLAEMNDIFDEPTDYLATKKDASHAYSEGFTMCIEDLDD